MVTLTPLTSDYSEQVAKLEVHDDQLPYVGTINEILAVVNNDVHPHLILSGGEVVGFFLIDTTYWCNYSFCDGESLGLRAFFIDKRAQGRGLGKAAVKSLAQYLSRQYSGFEKIYLTVNCKNPAAYSAYLKAGFNDTEELYRGGPAGPQHIMLLGLSA
ncbi:GNAT family N-acetyltransferase [Vibrio sonorensis]|uniref:GNAT family N-acetyltransferase n=1 Tax=Vibrio sonorensis TaxID=1004316 RepID=UPI0008D9EAF5|nr:GNAT family N-acetyltransferase [Vibrio sonorensis]